MTCGNYSLVTPVGRSLIVGCAMYNYHNDAVNILAPSLLKFRMSTLLFFFFFSFLQLWLVIPYEILSTLNRLETNFTCRLIAMHVSF